MKKGAVSAWKEVRMIVYRNNARVLGFFSIGTSIISIFYSAAKGGRILMRKLPVQPRIQISFSM